MPEIFVSLPLDRKMQQAALGTPPMRGHIIRSHSTKYPGFTMISRLCSATSQSRKTELCSDNFAICMIDTFCSIEMYEGEANT
jgi:hypothetical protein